MNNLLRLIAIIPLSALFSSMSAEAIEEDELLEPQKAFKTTATIDQTNKITVAIEIADGYYLYRDKIKLTSKTDFIHLSDIVTPAGKVKEDEFFGKIETYRHNVDITSTVLPPVNSDQFELSVRSQGCADIGICYPPMTLPFTLALNKTQTNPRVPESSLSDLSSSLGGGFGNEEEFLDPDIAFIPSLGSIRNNTIPINWIVADGYYLYKDKFAFEFVDDAGNKIGKAQLSKGKIKDDPFFGKIEVHRISVDAKLPFKPSNSTGQGILKVSYQGCADAGICYPPIKKEFPVNWSLISQANAETIPEISPLATKKDTQNPSSSLSEQDRLASSLSSNSLWATVFSFFGLGLLLALTPCVFPMIPILSSLIVGQGESITTAKSFLYSVVFVLAMAITYTIAGIAVGLSGENIQAIFQDPWILSAFAILFVVLSLSMFGFYELQMPSAIQGKLTAISNNQKGGSLIGVAIMGFLSALIVGPCVTAPLVGALIYIAQTGDAVIGGVALFSLSIGMGIPLIVIGVSAGKFMPRAGAWMEVTKSIFGVMLLGLAIWMLERFLPLSIIMALTAALTIVVSIYMGALDPVPEGSSGWAKFWKGIGLVLLIYGLMLLVGAASGGTSFISPLKGIVSSSSTGGSSSQLASTNHLNFKRIRSVTELESALQTAKNNGQPVMLDFVADWCISCKEMEAYTFSDSGVISALSNAVLLQADVTENNEDDKALLKHFKLFGPPGIIFYNKSGEEKHNSRVVGYMQADEFIRQINKAFI